MRTPKDQGLFFAVFFSLTIPVILLLWLLLPSQVKIGEDEGGEEAAPKKVLKGEDAIIQAEAELSKAEEILARLEKAKVGKASKDKEGKKPKISDKNVGTKTK